MTYVDIFGIICYLLASLAIFRDLYKKEFKDETVRVSIVLSMLTFCFCLPIVFTFVSFSDCITWVFKKVMKKTELLRWRMKYRFDPFEGLNEEVFTILKLEKETEKYEKPSKSH